jgi:endonuclease YncB( thermonuclease family)
MVKSAKIITLHNIGRDKYFRINADVLVDGKSLGAELIKNKLALPYFGDTKHDFTQMIEERKRSFIDEK